MTISSDRAADRAAERPPFRLPDRTSERNISRKYPVLYLMTVCIITVAFLRLGAELLIPLACATLLTLALMPAVRWLERLHVGSKLAAVSVITLSSLAAVLILSSLADQIGYVTSHPDMQGPQLIKKIDELLKRVNATLSDYGIHARFSSWGRLREWWVGEGNEKFFALLMTASYELKSPLGYFALVYLLTAYFLIENHSLRDRFYIMMGERHLYQATLVVAEGVEKIQSYLGAQVVVNFVCAAVTGGIYHFAGVPQPFLWGATTGCLRFIPVVGFWVGAIPPLFLSLVINDGFYPTGGCLLALLAFELVLSNVIEPFFVGKRSGINMLGVIASTIFWGWVWGIPGIILAMPITLAVSQIARAFPQFQLVPILLDVQPEYDPKLQLLHRVLNGEGTRARGVIRERVDSGSIEQVLCTLVLPCVAEVHRMNIRSSDPMHLKVQTVLDEVIEEFRVTAEGQTVSEEIEEVAHEEVAQEEVVLSGITDPIAPEVVPQGPVEGVLGSGGRLFIVGGDDSEQVGIGHFVSRAFRALGIPSSEVHSSTSPKEVLLRLSNSATPTTLVIPLVSEEDFIVVYKFLLRLLKADLSSLNLVVLWDAHLSVIPERVARILEDERVKVVRKWGDLLGVCQEVGKAAPPTAQSRAA